MQTEDLVRFWDYFEKQGRRELHKFIFLKGRGSLSTRDVEDIAQSAIMRLLILRERVPVIGDDLTTPVNERLMAWLKHEAKYRVWDRFRSTITRKTVALDFETEDQSPHGDPFIRRAWASALTKLTDQEWDVVSGKLLGNTHAEIAKELRIPETTVAYRFRVAKQKLLHNPRLSAIFKRGGTS